MPDFFKKLGLSKTIEVFVGFIIKHQKLVPNFTRMALILLVMLDEYKLIISFVFRKSFFVIPVTYFRPSAYLNTQKYRPVTTI
jgi:hypothetical protein